MVRLLGMAILVSSVAGYALGGVSTPEIDGSSAAAALGLVAGGILVLRSRKRRK
jgi:outer membrane lipoprotein SlyB